MVQYIKYQMPFADIEGKQYRVNIYGETNGTPPATIQLQAGDSPLVIDEDTSDDIFTPVRTQTGNLGVCTKLPGGGMLDLADLLPSTNLSTPVRVEELVNGSWQVAWLGFLSCEQYNQAYTNIPENISLPINSLLEAWKSSYITINKVETVAELLSELINIQPGEHFTGINTPQDYAIFEKYINTSIFIEKKEYQNEESTLYELQGSSAHDILSAICLFMGWTAREEKGVLYLEVLQGYGQISGTETRNISSLVWWGTNHQRSIRQGKRIGSVNAKLAAFEIDTGLAGIPFGSFNYEKYQQIAPPLQTGPWVYFLPSSNTDAYSNMTIRFFAGSLKMGIQNDQSYPYAFLTLSDDIHVNEMIEQTIPYSDDYLPLRQPTSYHTIYAGAVYARMQFDQSDEPDPVHQNTKDGLLVSFFPGAYAYTSNRSPIFEMLSVQNFAVMEDGYINISTELQAFLAAPSVGISQAQDRIVMDLQVGDKVWNGSAWVDATGNTAKLLMQLEQDGTKFKGNWDASMDIDETDGYLIPNWYTDGGVKKRVMGRVTLRIYPETYIQDIATAQRSNFICNIFFEELSFDYIMVRSVKLSDRSDNNYRRTINTEFKQDVEISTELASWFNNNPSPSLLYNDDQTPMKTLPYLTEDGETTISQRPEMNLLDRMQAYYSQPRTILQLPVKHIEDKPLPLLRFNGLDGNLYAPMAESNDYRTKESKITFIEIPNNE